VHHLDECFEKLRELEAEAVHAGEIEVALWFHDAIYDVRRSDNEAKSADWARTVATEAGVAGEAAERIHGLVMCTMHDAVPAGEDQRIVVDVDLSILGAPQERFDEYEAQIREEYAWVPEETFRARRRDVLAQFLARPSVFSTRTFLDRYETRARRNLGRSIRKLS
jgi:predicted metal-dependent HD superfamily phosphohydrolase